MSIVTENQPDGTPTWIDLGVPDLDRALDFYGALFGWQFDVGPAEYGRYTTAYAEGRPGRRAGAVTTRTTRFWWNVYLATADCDATAAAVQAAGGTVVDPPIRRDGPGPDGHRARPGRRAVRALAGPGTRRLRAGQRAEHPGPQRPGHRPARAWPAASTPRSSASPWTATRTCPTSTSPSSAGPTGTRSAASWACRPGRGRAGRRRSRSTTPTPRWPGRSPPAAPPDRWTT